MGYTERIEMLSVRQNSGNETAAPALAFFALLGGARATPSSVLLDGVVCIGAVAGDAVAHEHTCACRGFEDFVDALDFQR